MVLSLLEIGGNELLSAEGEQPEFFSLEVCLDSNAGGHVLAEVDGQVARWSRRPAALPATTLLLLVASGCGWKGR